MKQIVLSDNTSYDLISGSISENDGVQTNISVVILVPSDSELTKKNIVDKIETLGIVKVVEDDGSETELQEDFSLVLPDVVQNDGEFYLGTDEDGNKKYAKASVVLTALPTTETDTYIEGYRVGVIDKLSTICHDAIEAGLSIELSDGEEHIFSYNADDRENIKQMFDAIVMGATAYPYHENDGNCQTFSAADIVTIYTSMVKNKTHHTTYFNQLKQYIKTLNRVSAIAKVEYGQALTGVYLETYNANMAEAMQQLQNILSRIGGE